MNCQTNLLGFSLGLVLLSVIRGEIAQIRLGLAAEIEFFFFIFD